MLSSLKHPSLLQQSTIGIHDIVDSFKVENLKKKSDIEKVFWLKSKIYFYWINFVILVLTKYSQIT
jgi:hypothetical protein